MSSEKPETAANTKRRQPQQLIVGLFMLLLGVAPLLNALGNPRVQSLHGTDVLGLIAAGLCFGLGLGLLLGKLLSGGR